MVIKNWPRWTEGACLPSNPPDNLAGHLLLALNRGRGDLGHGLHGAGEHLADELDESPSVPLNPP